MKTTKITLTILTIIITLIALAGAITIKCIDKTDTGMMINFKDNSGYYIELNNDIKSINTENDITTITLKNNDKIHYNTLNGEYWSNDIKVINVEPTDNNSFKITLNDGSYLINKGLEYKYYN